MANELTCSDVGCLCGGFWVVLRDDGAAPGKLVKHPTEQEARVECERLAQKEQRPFYVLQSIGSARPTAPPIEWHDLLPVRFSTETTDG